MSDTPRSLLSSNDLKDLTDLIDRLDESGAEVTGTIRFKGRSIGIGYDAESECHLIGGV